MVHKTPKEKETKEESSVEAKHSSQENLRNRK